MIHRGRSSIYGPNDWPTDRNFQRTLRVYDGREKRLYFSVGFVVIKYAFYSDYTTYDHEMINGPRRPSDYLYVDARNPRTRSGEIRKFEQKLQRSELHVFFFFLVFCFILYIIYFFFQWDKKCRNKCKRTVSNLNTPNIRIRVNYSLACAITITHF